MTEGAEGAGRLLRDRWRLERVLGEGATARTWLAEDVRGEVGKVAVKEVPLDRLRTWKHRELLEREGAVLSQLDHPGIPRCYATFEEDEPSPTFYLVEGWIEGKLLSDRLAEAGRLPEREVWEVLLGALEILDYLHTLPVPVVHRDLKPSNLILRPDGRVALIDFGAVREVAAWKEDGTTVIGTFGYMAPEQLHGGVSPATDLYALAAMACHLLTGVHPRDMPVKGHPFQLDFRARCTVSDDLAALLDMMMRPDPDERLCEAAQVIEELEEIAATVAPPAELADAGAASMHLAAAGPRTLDLTHWSYAASLAPRWRWGALGAGAVAAFFGPLGWLVTAVALLVGFSNLRESWYNGATLRDGTLLTARVLALRPVRGGVELEYSYTFKRRTYQAGLLVKAHLTAHLQAGAPLPIAVDPHDPSNSVPLLGGGASLTPPAP